jgi:Skp family chaperone for outer membrane proteins
VKKINYSIPCLAAIVAGCAGHGTIGLVDVQRIVANWPEYQTYQTQLYSEERSIAGRRESTARKQSDTIALEKKYATLNDSLSKQIHDVAAKIATHDSLKLVLTREGIGYGGVDITSDVEKALNITEKATPTPGI